MTASVEKARRRLAGRLLLRGEPGYEQARVGTGVYLGDTDFTRRHDRFMSDDAYRRLAAIRAERDPGGRIASYLTCDHEGLNVHG